MIREIEARSHGGYSPSPGVVYPALTFMEEAGLIAVAADEGARKSYAATGEGEGHVAAHADEVAAVEARLAALAEMRERTDAAPVKRAMQNLKTAIFDRLSQENAGRDTVLQVADLIDQAARQIERIET
ncbi:PadR family transcriptional regulator [Croceicoccus estronivorus]|uniref:PadR family transcriptional regulator n=1 Tax=Croceicoccus estronivorus TaxID=1172626 RepID=UPI001F1B0B68|nr:PadR family transcriptional regulator [Croceicoccus estronivorus]